jgi:hypothetical protein
LIVERRRNGNDIFYLRNCCRSQIFLRSHLRLFRDGGNEFFRNFLLLEADACVNWTDRSLSSFSEKKNVTSNRCRALQSKSLEKFMWRFLSWVWMNYQDFLENLFFLL